MGLQDTEAFVIFDSLVLPGYNPRLMSGRQDRLPVEVDPFRMAEQGRQIQGLIEFKQLKRLEPLLDSKTGHLDVELKFGIDARGTRRLSGRIEGMVSLTCQRCLSEMNFSLANEFNLALLKHESEIAQLGEEYEPLILESTPVRLAEIIEDEVLLAIPQIPMHEFNDCPASKYGETEKDTEQEDNQNPFAVLADLKKDN